MEKNIIQNKQLQNKTPIQRIWTVGSGSSGILFADHLEDIYEFKEQNIKKEKSEESVSIHTISYDGMMALGLDDKNQVYRWGECKLIPGDKKKKDIIIRPQLLEISTKIQINNISCGWHHAIFYNSNDISQIYGFGSNSFGELGLGKANKQFICEPQQLNLSQKFTEQEQKCQKIKNIHTGFRQTYIFLEDGQLYVTGQNKSYELGLSTKENKVLYDFTPNPEFLQQFTKEKQIKHFQTGYKFGCILTECNEVYSWGDNKYKQISDGEDKTIEQLQLVQKDVKQVELGWSHLFALLNNGQLYLRGRNDMGQLGIGQNSGKNESFIDLKMIKEEKIIDISCGSECNYVLTDYGQVYAWGWNEHGNLGNNSLENIYEPTLIPLDQKEGCSKKLYSPDQIKAKGAICMILQYKNQY